MNIPSNLHIIVHDFMVQIKFSYFSIFKSLADHFNMPKFQFVIAYSKFGKFLKSQRRKESKLNKIHFTNWSQIQKRSF